MAVKDWSTTPASNVSVGGKSIAEGMAPGDVNDAIRAIMADGRARFDEIPSTRDYGAVGNGSTNDSAAFTAGIAAKSQIRTSAGDSYSIKDVALSNNQSVHGTGQILSAATAGTNLFSLSNFNPQIRGIYVSSGLNASESLIRVKASRYAEVSGITAVNCGPGFIKFAPVTPASENVALPLIADCRAEDVTGIGIDIGSSVSEIQTSNLHIYGKLVAGSGGNLRPTFTTIGWRQNTPVVGGQANGGHQAVNANMINFNRGFYLTDASLAKFSNCDADSCSDYAVLLDGACDFITFSDLFVGTSRGIKVGGASQRIHFNGLETVLNGVIPPWGATDFFNGVGTFYDLEVRDTAKVRVSNWRGDKRIIVDSTASLLVDDGETLQGRSVGTVAVGTTAFLMEAGAQATEVNAIWRAPYDGYLIRISPTCSAAPGAGQSFVYTARVNSVDQTLTQTISGASAFGGIDTWAGALVAVNKGDSVAIKLVTSAAAALATHQCQLQLAPR